MSRDDPYYAPTNSNPFAGLQRFKDGHKVFGTSCDINSELYDLPSPAYPFTPPVTPITPDLNSSKSTVMWGRNCHSLPTSPVLLRRAAEKLHQESLHGSAKWNSSKRMNQRSRSKSAIISDAVAIKLQYDFVNNPQRFQRNEPISESSDESESVYLDCPIDFNPTPRNIQSSQWSSGKGKSFPHFKQQSMDCVYPLATSSCPNGNRLFLDKRSGYDYLPLESAGLKDKQRDFSPPSMRSSCESFMSIDEHFLSPTSSLSSYSEPND